MSNKTPPTEATTPPLMFNPWTGRPRHPADITSDPAGILMVPPDTPLLAAAPDQGDGSREGATIADYEQVLADHRRLVRSLDVIWNGEEGAAKQASLCDMVAQIRQETNGIGRLALPSARKDAPEQAVAQAEFDGTAQDWQRLDGATAWHLIERHAEDWTQVGQMMDAWLAANSAHPPRLDAQTVARSLTDELMDCVDRLGSEAATVDPRVWEHLLAYAPPHPRRIEEPGRIDEMVKRLRYMGRQYSAGQAARGGGPQKHYLEEAADLLESLSRAEESTSRLDAQTVEDAKRYRWLRENSTDHFDDNLPTVMINQQNSWGNWRTYTIEGEKLDEAIDRALRST